MSSGHGNKPEDDHAGDHADGHAHEYRTTLGWSGSTGTGYEAYDRGHDVRVAPTTSLAVSADPAFRGDPQRTNPEALLLAAASSCQLLSFLAVAARARVDVVDYADEALAVMPARSVPTRITRIELAPRIVVRRGGSDASGDEALRAKVERLVRLAHEECYIANSLTAAIEVRPGIELRD